MESIEYGSNVVVIISSLSAKTSFIEKILTGAEENVGNIYVTTKDTAEEVLTRFKNVDLRIIDCVSRLAVPDMADVKHVKRISSPMDLAGISAAVNKFLEEYFREGKRAILIFDSLSNLLIYSNVQRILRFLHVLTIRIKITKAKGFYIVDREACNDKALAMLKQLFNGIIEITEEGNKRVIKLITPNMRKEWEESLENMSESFT